MLCCVGVPHLLHPLLFQSQLSAHHSTKPLLCCHSHFQRNAHRSARGQGPVCLTVVSLVPMQGLTLETLNVFLLAGQIGSAGAV